MQALGTQPGCHVMLTLVPLSISCQRNMPPVLENLTLTLEKDKHHLPLDAHLAMESLSVWDALSMSYQSHLFISYLLSQCFYTSHAFFCVCGGR